MSDLKDPQDEWEVEEVRDKQRIKGVIHYLVKWAGWPSEYNFYEPASHLVDAPKAIADYERKLKRSRKKVKIGSKIDIMDDDDRAASSGDEPAPRKRIRRSRA